MPPLNKKILYPHHNNLPSLEGRGGGGGEGCGGIECPLSIYAPQYNKLSDSEATVGEVEVKE